MPYIVPSTTPTSTCKAASPPHSPSRPPLAFSMAVANPAPVPPHTSFTSPALPNSPSFVNSNSQRFGSLSNGASPFNSSLQQQHPPLMKAMSYMNTPTTSSAAKNASSSGSTISPPMRRATSASSASPTSSPYRFSNAAGNGLPHIPRRRGGNPFLSSAQTDEATTQSQVTPPRGRTRSRFVLGGEEESASASTSASDEERRNADGAETKGDKLFKDVEERVARRRPISSERSTRSSLSPPMSAFSDNAELTVEHSESGSECPTPTQKSMALRLHSSQGNAHRPNSPDGESSILGIAPRAQRGRGRGHLRKLLFDDDPVDEVRVSRLLPIALLTTGQPKDETSTVAFPSSNSPSPPPAIEVATATPETTPFSSPLPDGEPPSQPVRKTKPGSLRLDFSFGGSPGEPKTNSVERGTAADHGRAMSESTSLNSVIRKKSGEIVRPSLKSRSSSANAARHRPSLSLGDISSFAGGSPSVSAPTTPATAKMVHFDAQLEHVKLFKSTSKPASVSRNGSPTYDDTTSGGEGDSASEGGGSLSDFIPRPRPRRLVPGGTPKEEADAVRRVLMMRLLNMPQHPSKTEDVDVRLEGLHLADDAETVQGLVRVRNYAFEKTVAVRFTFDGWQTTSEVIARWVESCILRNPSPSSVVRSRSVSTPVVGMKTAELPAPTFDRFSFSIRLADMLLRIDEKTLVLAVRYCSAGREMWDNNNGQNYRAVFERHIQHALTLAGSAVVSAASPDGTKEKSRTGDSGRKVGNAVTTPSAGTSDAGRVRPADLDLHDTKDKVKSKEGVLLSPAKKTSDLSMRYDLDMSLKNPTAWRPNFGQAQTWSGHAHARNPLPWLTEAPHCSHDAAGPSSASASSESWKSRQFESHAVNFNARALPRGSPRDLDRETMDDSEVERYSRARFAVLHDGSTPDCSPYPKYHSGANRFVSPPTSFMHTGSESHTRNHHRSYFDAWASGTSTPGFGTGKARLTPPGTPDSLSTCRTLSDAESIGLPSTNTSRSSSMEHPPSSLPERHYPFPPLMAHANGNGPTGLGLLTTHSWTDIHGKMGQDPVDSEASTPSITSVSSPTMTVSPSSPPDFSSLMPSVHTESTGSSHNGSMASNNYDALLSSYCFYRGMDGRLDVPAADIRRIHSASEVEELLSPPPSSSVEVEAYPLLKGSPPSRSPSSADSCPTTPTGHASPGTVEAPPTSAGLLETESGVSTRVSV